jgi:hypothetical protein
LQPFNNNITILIWIIIIEDEEAAAMKIVRRLGRIKTSIRSKGSMPTHHGVNGAVFMIRLPKYPHQVFALKRVYNYDDADAKQLKVPLTNNIASSRQQLDRSLFVCL